MRSISNPQPEGVEDGAVLLGVGLGERLAEVWEGGEDRSGVLGVDRDAVAVRAFELGEDGLRVLPFGLEGADPLTDEDRVDTGLERAVWDRRSGSRRNCRPPGSGCPLGCTAIYRGRPPPRPCISSGVRLVDRVRACRDRVNEREHLAPGMGSACPLSQANHLVHHLLDAEPPAQEVIFMAGTDGAGVVNRWIEAKTASPQPAPPRPAFSMGSLIARSSRASQWT